MAWETVEDLEDNIWCRQNTTKITEILQEKLSTVAISQTLVSSYSCY